MSNYQIYVTTEGDRWDLIAYRFYSNPYLYQPLIEANIATIGTPPILSGGLRLNIPTLPEAQTIPANLPPWKR